MTKDSKKPKDANLQKVLVGLRCLAKGAFFSEVADTHGVSRSSVCRIIHGFVDAVIYNVDNIKFPVQRDDQMSVKRGFYRKCKFPNIVGAVDGTLVPILAPTANEESFVCRKGFHAINCQAVASSDLRFIDIVAKWPGSSHDAGVFDNSVLKDYLEADLEAVLLGDSGYPLRRYLITPILHPSNENEERYNRRHKTAREVVERAFGVLKSRFRCLHRSGGVLPFSPGKSCRFFLACCKLHNLCIDNNMPLPDAIVCADDQGIQQNQEATRPGLTTRAQYIQLP
ncbi:putative nuclease HARBI1 isoform X2 [Mya arenaria]|uniref:putative nuclease HARBI1 isoform X2 n=1 Tax=Mya arenaria TaxID=6604 RepID=UPI0022E00DE5|nr:putative nuclease HARBI1 isoform X2 [Mya arenaria]